ncbi:hypothetical protein [Pseudomonas brassicacearum]|uniref:hypothetical protein n=1 Tax=Pseudomonas brassicacearum TaxID=930166 RepID=UPI001612155B|nr:hypothetical protein [Pseudomonas brassicacearum]
MAILGLLYTDVPQALFVKSLKVLNARSAGMPAPPFTPIIKPIFLKNHLPG